MCSRSDDTMFFEQTDIFDTKRSNVALYDATVDEINQRKETFGICEDNYFSISHPEPNVRPAIALNLTHEEISELRGVCFSESFSIPKNVTESPSWTSKLVKYCQYSQLCWVKVILNLILFVGWSSFFGLILSGSIYQVEDDPANRWTILTFIFMTLLLATISIKKLFSRHKNKSDSTKAVPFSYFQFVPCLKNSKDEETTILYSVKT